MIRGLRRILILLLFAVLIQLQANAQATTANNLKVLNVRVNNVGAQISAEINGEPGSWVSVELLYPEADVADAYNADKPTDALAGLDMLQLSESGEAVYTYTAQEQTGIYTLRVSGAVDSVGYTATDNELTAASSDVLFAEMWTSGYENVYTDYVQGAVWLKRKMLNNMESTAKRIKTIMDLRAPGRRMLYIDTDIGNMFIDNSENYIWEWSEVEAQAELLEEFFSIYYHIGGQLDGIYTDCEHVMSTWELQRLVSEAGKAAGDDAALKEQLKAEALQSVLDGIMDDPVYTEKIEPELIKRGFYFHDGDELHKLYQAYSSYNGKNAEYGNEYAGYLVWSTVMDNYKNVCLRAAVYEPVAKYFPHIIYSNYSSFDRLAPLYSSGSHKYYLAGNKIKAGTHSSPVLYDSAATENGYSPDGTTYAVSATPFAEVVALVNSMRETMLSTHGGKVTPWVNAKFSNDDFNYIKNDLDYYYEYFFHVAMCNPDALLFYGPYYNTDTSNEDVDENIDSLYRVMEELGEYISREGAKTLIGDTANSHYGYILSGMSTGGCNLWRITYDNTVPEEGQSFLIDDSNVPAFYINGTRIEFPQGTILQNIHSNYGYWVETPSDVYPVITYDNPPETCELTLRLYDDAGMPLPDDAEISEIGTVALFYDGLLEYASLEDKALNFVKYDDNGMVSMGPLKSSIWGGTSGQLVFNEFNSNGKSKILIWESLGGLKPVTPALPWDGR